MLTSLPEDDTIPEEILAQYDIEIDLYADFLKAVKVIALQSTANTSFADALLQCGVPKNAKYTPKWQKLFRAAGDLIHKQLSQEVKTVVTSTVQNKWPAIIHRMTNIALNGSDRDAIESTKFLQTFYIGPAMVSNDSDEENAKEFLKRPLAFNPLDVIHKGSLLSDAMNREAEAQNTEQELSRLQSGDSEHLQSQ